MLSDTKQIDISNPFDSMCCITSTRFTIISFQPLPADEPVRLPIDEPITTLIVSLEEKYIQMDPIEMTIQVWGCFVPGLCWFTVENDTLREHVFLYVAYCVCNVMQTGLQRWYHV